MCFCVHVHGQDRARDANDAEVGVWLTFNIP